MQKMDGMIAGLYMESIFYFVVGLKNHLVERYSYEKFQKSNEKGKRTIKSLYDPFRELSMLAVCFFRCMQYRFIDLQCYDTRSFMGNPVFAVHFYSDDDRGL